MTGAQRGHRALSHTADVILEAWAPDLASCCEEAVAALVETFAVTERAEVVGEHHLFLRPATPQSLLVGVVDEAIFVLDTADEVPVGATVRATVDGGLEVVLAMADRTTVGGTGAAPKAVSLSGLEVDTRQDHVRCRLLIDL